MASLLFFVFDRIINEISIIKPVTTKNNCNQFKNQVFFNSLCEILARNKIMHFKNLTIKLGLFEKMIPLLKIRLNFYYQIKLDINSLGTSFVNHSFFNINH